MTEFFNVQCQSCGTFYNDLQDVCPYCGEPQPDLSEHNSALRQEDFLDDPMLEDELTSHEDALPAEEVDPYLHEPAPLDDELEEGYLLHDEASYEDHLFTDDDIFAVAGDPEAEEQATAYLDDYDDYEDEYASYLEPAEAEGYDDFDDGAEDEEDSSAGIFTWRRILSGCLVALACFGLAYAGLGLLAVREGLEERTLIAQTESQAHYEKGQEHLANNAIELAIAEFERALSLNPNFSAARQALREAQQIAQTQPTPTSETRSAAASGLFTKAEAQLDQQDWADALQTLSQVRDLDPDFQADQVSEMLYEANFQRGLQLKTSERLEDAVTAFENALAERPGNPQVLTEQTNALLYLDGVALESSDIQRAIEIFSQLHQQDESYLDVKERLSNAYELHGDELARAGAWCRAENHYKEANTLQSSRAREIKAENSSNRCQDSQEVSPPPAPTNTPAARVQVAETRTVQLQPTPTITATNVAAQSTPNRGSIIYSTYNPFESRWEIVAVPAGGGSPRVVAINGTMPAVSPDGQLLLYHSELVDSEGLHALNLATGQDTRVTKIREHILPRWGGDNNQFIFVAQEAGTGRWQVHRGFADAKSDPIIVRDGRTPDWSPNGLVIAYQGTDPIGNNPGIYLVPFGGGEPTRLTNHQSDRSPAFSPDGTQMAYMSTREGNWDVFIVSTAGSAPRQITRASGNDGLPTWSLDGSQLAYVSDADGSWAIYVVDAAGGTPVKVSDWDGTNRPDWLLAQIWWAP